ncbi:phosphate signaling complex protein PhoU [candidate division WOR-3 bacterium]|nr:phosphate signaling complex protein PhoU [candidate division WOR-3 bacterium]
MLTQKIVKLKEKLFSQAGLVEEMVTKSTRALVEKNESIAKETIKIDEPKVNNLEMEIEEDAINLMALYQPEASDLRTIIMIIKINKDLERIGDHAVNIAERALDLISKPKIKPLIDIPRMAENACKMLRESLNAFAKNESKLAIEVCENDSVVDALLDQITRELLTYMMSDPSVIDRALNLILISRDLERIADLATNIAEDTIFVAKGNVIKHHKGNE